MHPNEKLVRNWDKELKLMFKVIAKKKADWKEITDEIDAFQDKVFKMGDNIIIMINSPDAGQFAPLILKGKKLIDQNKALTENMVAYYEELKKHYLISMKMTDDLNTEMQTFDAAKAVELIKRCRVVLNEGKRLLAPIEEDLEERIDQLLEGRDALEETLNSMTE